MQVDTITDSFTSGLEVCFEILLYLNSRMRHLAPGDCFEFISTDPEARERVAEWCDLRGYCLLSSEAMLENGWRLLIQK